MVLEVLPIFYVRLNPVSPDDVTDPAEFIGAAVELISGAFGDRVSCSMAALAVGPVGAEPNDGELLRQLIDVADGRADVVSTPDPSVPPPYAPDGITGEWISRMVDAVFPLILAVAENNTDDARAAVFYMIKSFHSQLKKVDGVDWRYVAFALWHVHEWATTASDGDGDSLPNNAFDALNAIFQTPTG